MHACITQMECMLMSPHDRVCVGVTLRVPAFITYFIAYMFCYIPFLELLYMDVEVVSGMIN